MRIEIGVAHRDVNELYARFGELFEQPDRLCRVKSGAFGMNAEAVGVGQAVMGVEARGDYEAGGAGLYRAGDALPQQPGAVFERAAVAPGAAKGREQLAVEIAVAAFDVHSVKSGAFRKRSRADERLFGAV